MKKVFALVVALLMGLSILAGCTQGASGGPEDGKVKLRVVSSFGGDDGNRLNYEEAYKAWEEKTGNTIQDESETSDETWKAKVLADFETGSEADIVFFFNGMDSNPLVESGKVVSVDEIRAEFPTYASNMDDAKLGASPYDGKNYSIPTAGYWEGMYVNLKVLEEAGVEMPTASTTWEEFLVMCEAIKAAGKTPIAASLNAMPHYWLEFAMLNNGSPSTHLTLPAKADDKAFKSWASAFEDITELYEKGYFPADTLTASDDEIFQLMTDNEAAFAIEGSWKMNWFVKNAEDLNDFAVTFVPGKGDRAPTDIIGGLSMGYYITRKAWDDPAKRAAAVEFVQHMTTDEVVNKMAAGTAATALKTGTAAPTETNPLLDSALSMIGSSTTITPAVQDLLTTQQRDVLFPDNTKKVVTGEMTAEDSIKEALGL